MKKKLALIIMMAMLVVTGCNSNQSQTEQKEKVKIGITQFIDHVSLNEARDGFLEKLDESGIEYELVEENQNGDMSLTTTMAEKLKGGEVDLIYAISTPSAQGVKNVVQDIPVVFSAVTDPVGAGLVESIENPGGNITGVSDYIDPSNQIDMFLKIYPEIKTFGVLYNTSEQNAMVQIEELEKILEEKGLKLETIGVTSTNDIPQAMVALGGKIDALYALTDNMIASAAPVVSEKLIQMNIPSLSAEEGQVTNGLLMSEGVDYKNHGAQAGEMAIKILNGESAENIPVEYNKENVKKINKGTAERLNLDLSIPELSEFEIIE